ncbi:helicase HerA-like domain-containing protein [Miltoncostaea marina]|uniref:helicase HerA-like domain-containing protein n=1 Tax=Miltoncostaea marina TaxID=2843215 RepID=UPI001C3E48D7|nr:helicase HerA-like domain-containing protein [Miltoncostaea marina]
MSFRDDMAAGYAAAGATLPLGRPFPPGEAPDTAVEVGIPLALANRHGLIAGATGTGKTRTLQLLAEGLSAAGVPVFAADMKGDLAGLGAPGDAGERVTARARELAVDWSPAAVPVELLSLTGEGGAAVRATVSEFGPTLLAKVLGCNETQEASLSLVFRHCDAAGLPLVDLEDLRAALAWLTGPGKAELTAIGGIPTATAGVLLRKVAQLEGEGGDLFFGEPAFEVADLVRTSPDGRGVVSVLDLVTVARRPALFSTFLMWLLAELFERLPEVGDPERPVLVFVFDEAHLLFDDASDAFLDAVAQTVRLIRSKGVGVYFVTQLPTDIPDEVLAQLGHRVQHAVRAFTPRDARALSAVVETFPATARYDLAETLRSMGTGEAVVTVLDERGVPTPVAATRLFPPRSRMAPLSPEERAAALAASPLPARYGERLDRESAAELLEARMAGDAARAERVRESARRTPPAGGGGRRRAPAPSDPSPLGRVEEVLGSPLGRRVTREVVRGIFGMLLRR